MTRWSAMLVSIPVVLALAGGCAGLTGTGKTAAPLTPAELQRAGRDKAIDNARKAFAQAKAEGGEFAAPFEFYLADEYLSLAEEEARGGDKDGVIVFAERSAAYSGEAVRAAGRNR